MRLLRNRLVAKVAKAFLGGLAFGLLQSSAMSLLDAENAKA